SAGPATSSTSTDWSTRRTSARRHPASAKSETSTPGVPTVLSLTLGRIFRFCTIPGWQVAISIEWIHPRLGLVGLRDAADARAQHGLPRLACGGADVG